MSGAHAKQLYLNLSMPKDHQRGEKNSMAKLNEDKVRDIRRRVALGEKQEAIAHDYEVSRGLVGQIFARRRWPHVE